MLIAVRKQHQQLRFGKHWIDNGHWYHVKCKIPRCKLHVTTSPTTVTLASLTSQQSSTVGTCESEIFVRIESRIKSAATTQIRIESGIKSGCSRLRVQCRLTEVMIIITDEQKCAVSPWFRKQYCTIAPTVLASVYRVFNNDCTPLHSRNQ